MDQQVKQYKKQLQNIYKPQAQILREQYQAQLPQFKAEEESLKQAKVNAFRDIGREANRSGMFFSGFRPEEQARYVGEEYLPALAGVSQQRNQLKLDLRSALAGLDTERRTSVMDFREQLRQEAAERRRIQEEREFQAQQAALDRQLTRGGAGYSGGGSSDDDVDYSAELIGEMNEWFERSDSMPSRQAQDKFVDSWMDRQGISRDDSAARQVFWDAVNAYYNRTGDPTKDYYWR